MKRTQLGRKVCTGNKACKCYKTDDLKKHYDKQNTSLPSTATAYAAAGPTFRDSWTAKHCRVSK